MNSEFLKNIAPDDVPEENTVKKFLETLTWYFSEKQTPSGFFHTIGRIDEKLGNLIDTLKKADESSTKLTQALNRITLAGVVIALIGILIAAGNLILEVYKFKAIK